MKQWLSTTALATAFLSPQMAWAASQGFGWESAFQRILNSLQGPVVGMIGTAALVIFGLTLAVSEGGAGFNWALRILVGISIAATAASIVVNVFGFGGGAVFA